MTRAFTLSLAGAAAALAAASGAHAMDIRQMCASTARSDAVRSCSVIIAESLAPAEDRIIAMRNRGYSHQLQGDLDLAISDYNAAIKLSQVTVAHPHGQDARILARTLVDRGVAWREKGDPDKALADFDAAETADPTLVSAAENRDALYFKKR